jgi:methylisocitrate lyase
MVLKLVAALDARRDPNLVIIARTDARAIEGLDAAIERANQYGEIGADLCFIEAPASREELQRIPRAVHYPMLVNMLAGGVTPILSVSELQELGFKIAVCPIESLLVTATAVRHLIQTFLDRGRVDLPPEEMMTFAEVKQLLGVDEVLGLRSKLARG